MKKIQFNIRDCVGGYDKNLHPKTQLRKCSGYLFGCNKYQFVVHKYEWPSGYRQEWRVSEFTTGCGITRLVETRKEAMAVFDKMRKREDFYELLAAKIADIIAVYGKAN